LALGVNSQNFFREFNHLL